MASHDGLSQFNWQLFEKLTILGIIFESLKYTLIIKSDFIAQKLSKIIFF